MTVFELIKKVEECEIDEKKVNAVEDAYGPVFSDFTKRFISLELDNRMLYDYYGDTWQVRALSFFEMVSNKDFMEEIYPDKDLIPLIQWGELDIICYDAEEDEFVDLETEILEIVQSEVDFQDVAQSLHDGLPELPSSDGDF